MSLNTATIRRIPLRRSRIPEGFWFTAYDAFLPFGVAAARAVAWKHAKLRRALDGRRRGVGSWTLGDDDGRIGILIHAASAGEYEGAMPLVDRLLKAGDYRVAISFSSPSALPQVAATDGLWGYGYLPHDFLSEQLRLLAAVEPRLVLVTKHDAWPNLVRAAAALGVPAVYLNANFPSGSSRTNPLLKPALRAFMRYFDAIWTVAADDATRARRIVGKGEVVECCGDTRYDRVRQRAFEGSKEYRSLIETIGDARVIVAGSTWRQCKRLLLHAFANVKRDHTSLKLFIAPHEPSPETLASIANSAAGLGMRVKLLSDCRGEAVDEDVVLVDRLGVLAGLYCLGWCAYVGGGFGKGVHSVIEPAAHGIPVMFGPRHNASHEAQLLLESGGGFTVKNAGDIEAMLRCWLDEADKYTAAAAAAGKVVSDREGAADRIMEKLARYLG